MLSILIILISKTPIEIKSSWLYHDYTLLCQSREAIRWNVAKHPPLSSLGRSPPFPRPHRFWRAAQGGKHTHRLRRTPGATTLTFTHVPSAQFGYVIFDFIADSIPGLHRRILSAVTIARRSSHAMVHFHPESSSPANEYWSEALARPPSALGAEGLLLLLSRFPGVRTTLGNTRFYYAAVDINTTRNSGRRFIDLKIDQKRLNLF